MRDIFVGTISISIAAVFVAIALFFAMDVVPEIIARMKPIHASILFITLMILPFSKWIGQGVRDALRSRARSRA